MVLAKRWLGGLITHKDAMDYGLMDGLLLSVGAVYDVVAARKNRNG